MEYEMKYRIIFQLTRQSYFIFHKEFANFNQIFAQHRPLDLTFQSILKRGVGMVNLHREIYMFYSV